MREHRKTIVLVATLGLLLVAGAGFFAYKVISSDTTAKVRDAAMDVVVGKDSGVVACEAIRDSIEESETTGETAEVFTEDEYQAVRKMFADSDHEAIRTNGTKLVDLGWQMQQMTDENGDVGMEAFVLLSPFMEAYVGLSGGCAEQGVVIPPLDMQQP